jgi:hypothetical protein
MIGAMRLLHLSVLLVAACGGSSESSHTTKPPIVHIGEPTKYADYHKGSIKTGVESHRDAIRLCYEQALQAQPGLAGKVVAKFTIGLEGTVVQATAEGLDPGVDACVEKVILAMTFPKPDGGVVSVTYPFDFAPDAPAPTSP